MQVGVHARLEDRDAPELVELGGVRLVVEGAGDEHVEACVGGLAGGLDEVRPRHRAELRPDEDAGALLGTRAVRAGAAVGVASLGADHLARPRGDRGELDAVFLVRLLHAGGAQMGEDRGAEVLRLPVCARRLGDAVDEFVVLVDAEDAVRREALDRERPGDAHLAVVGRRACRRGTRSPPSRRSRRQSRAGARCAAPTTARAAPALRPATRPRLRAGSPIPPTTRRAAAFNCSRSGSRVPWNCSQMTSISALLAMSRSWM